METFAFRWFSLIYPMLGLLLVLGGGWILTSTGRTADRLYRMAADETPPAPFVSLIRFLILLTLPSVLFSVWPLSWPELLFAVWSLVMIFTAGQLLVHWRSTAEVIRANRDHLPGRIRLIAANMISIGLILFLLFYHLISTK